MGIFKAYTSRVGEGPFPTELLDETGDALREAGFEFGTTTGRPRRCGWADALVGRYATRVNGLTDMVLTKLDTLTGFETLRVATGYRVPAAKASGLGDGRREGEWVYFDEMPMSQSDFHHAEPVYEDHAGWTEDITGCRAFDELPRAAQDYVLRLEELIGTRISVIGVGPGREQSIVRHELAPEREVASAC